MNKIWTGKIEKGRLILDDQSTFKKFIETLPDKNIELFLRTPKKIRSNQQNRHYWGVVVKLLAEHFGYTSDEMHGVLKWKFASRLDLNTTTAMSTSEFSNQYVEEIRKWALNDYQIYIPLPDEVD